MYVYIKQLGIVCLLCWLGLSCTLQRTEHPVISSTSTTFKVSASSASTLPVARRQKIPAKILYLFINCFFKHLQSKGILAEGTILIY